MTKKIKIKLRSPVVTSLENQTNFFKKKGGSIFWGLGAMPLIIVSIVFASAVVGCYYSYQVYLEEFWFMDNALGQMSKYNQSTNTKQLHLEADIESLKKELVESTKKKGSRVSNQVLISIAIWVIAGLAFTFLKPDAGSIGEIVANVQSVSNAGVSLKVHNIAPNVGASTHLFKAILNEGPKT